jgi:hypothetical protein
VRSKFGDEAALDVRDVLIGERVPLECALLAFARLLGMDRERVRAPGAAFRSYTRLARENRLASPLKAAPITELGRLGAELLRVGGLRDAALLQGDAERAYELSREYDRIDRLRYELGQRLQRARGAA